MTHYPTYEPKPLFEERMKELLGVEEYSKFMTCIRTSPLNFFRCNTLKIKPNELKKQLEENYGWIISQPYKKYPEIMLIESHLNPGEFGKTIEHILGYYYIQEVSSMMSVIALNPKPNEIFLDLCAAPGSKTTHAAMLMENKGTIIANEKSFGRLSILATNLERCGVSNTILTKKDGVIFCQRLRKDKKLNLQFDKILVDAPCSGEGTLRSSPKTLLMWNVKVIESLSRLQKKLVAEAFSVLKKDGELLYSTCTHSPEENEEVVDFILKNFPVEIQKIEIPLKSQSGITQWNNKKYDERVKFSHRIYPQENNTEGFFLAKFKLLKEINKGEKNDY